MATLDAVGEVIVVADDAGTIVRRLPIPEIGHVRGFRWLASEAGFAVWSDERVYTVDIDDRRPPLIAFRIEQQTEGYPYSLHGVRSLPEGLLITAESCARERGLVGLHAHVVHLDGATPHSQTPLEPWAGAVLYDAFGLSDGRIVLSLSEQEYFDAMRLRCFGDLAKVHGYRDGDIDRDLICRVEINQRSLGASTFRVLEIEAPARVRVVGEHACQEDRGCWPQNWAPSADELIWGTAHSARRLRSPLETDPLFPTAGVWSDVALVPNAVRGDLGSLWLHDGHLLAANRSSVAWTSLDGGARWDWSPRNGAVKSARLNADRTSAVVTTPRRVLLFDLATGRHKRILRLRDVDADFDPSLGERFFSDAAVTHGGALVVDIAAAERLRTMSQIGTAPGYGHQGCDQPPPPDREAKKDYVRRARAIAPWFRERDEGRLF